MDDKAPVAGSAGTRRLCYPPSTVLWLLFTLVTLAGCLPSSCQRQESRALLPADSLSRRRAEAVPMDTMRLVWRASGSEALPMAYPRTVRFGPDGRVYVSDVERNSVLVFSTDGGQAEEVAPGAFAVPYLAGFRGDTLVVFNPPALRLDLVLEGRVVRSLAIPAEPVRGALVYAAASDSAYFFKQIGGEVDGYLVRLDANGDIAGRFALDGPVWRYAGLLRVWGDSLLSLSGYRPVADVLAGQPMRRDTLALVGFDSPMLPRSRLFLLGEVGEPPLLTPAADAAGELLFVLNLRPGWLQIDVFDRAGLLQRRLTQAVQVPQKAFFPQDLAVRRHPDGGYEAAVVFNQPEPRVELYRF